MRYYLLYCLCTFNLLGATYYVSNSGNDSNAGTSTGTAWQTITHVNAQTFLPGDSILLQKGGTWLEGLIIPSSGSINNPITFSSYGAGVQPILDEATTLGSGWTLQGGGFHANTWAVTLTTQPNILLIERIAGVQGASSTTLAAFGQWFWAANTLYLNSAIDPGSLSVPGVETPTRTYGIDLNGKNYINISEITILGANYHGVVFSASDTGVTLSSNTITLNGDAGIQSLNLVVATSILISNNIITWNGANGVLALKGVHDWTVQNNNISHSCQNPGLSVNQGGQLITDWQFCGGIRFWEVWTDNTSTIYNILVQGNFVSYDGQLSDGTYITSPNAGNVGGVGIWFDVIDHVFGGNIIANNITLGNLFAQIQLEHNQHVQAYGNIAYNSAAGQFTVGIFVTDSLHAGIRINANNIIYNNTVYGNTSYGIRNEGSAQNPTAGTCLNNIFQNNISENNGLSLGGAKNQLLAQVGGENDGTFGSGNVYTYNSFGVAASNFIQWAASTNYSTYATWEGAAGNCGTTGCSHSVQSDPLLTNPNAGDMRPARGSPALTGSTIGTGIGALGVVTPSLIDGLSLLSGKGLVQ